MNPNHVGDGDLQFNSGERLIRCIQDLSPGSFVVEECFAVLVLVVD